MTTAILTPTLTFKSWLNNGTPNAFGTVATYQAGSTTPIATYTDYTGGTPNANPVPLNARGEANIWLPPNVAFKFVEADSVGNAIKTTDQVTQSQLLSLYGGVDTGSANAYDITYPSPVQSPYTDGTIIYWIAAHSNTGASTINVNGLGPVNIYKQDGTALAANNIFANQVTIILYQVSIGGFKLISSGSIAPDLYGGVSGGSSNNYTLTFSSQFAAYADGVLVYWIPNGSNTAAATLNVNGLGAIAIVNQDGSALGRRTLVSGQIAVVMYKGGNFLLISTGNATNNGVIAGVMTGITGSPATSLNYVVSNGLCTLVANTAATGTSSSTALTMTGLPSQCQPPTTSPIVPCILTDNTAAIFGYAQINNTTGTIVFGFGVTNNQSGFTASGTKGMPNNWTITYPLT